MLVGCSMLWSTFPFLYFITLAIIGQEKLLFFPISQIRKNHGIQSSYFPTKRFKTPLLASLKHFLTQKECKNARTTQLKRFLNQK